MLPPDHRLCHCNRSVDHVIHPAASNLVPARSCRAAALPDSQCYIPSGRRAVCLPTLSSKLNGCPALFYNIRSSRLLLDLSRSAPHDHWSRILELGSPSPTCRRFHYPVKLPRHPYSVRHSRHVIRRLLPIYGPCHRYGQPARRSCHLHHSTLHTNRYCRRQGHLM